MARQAKSSKNKNNSNERHSERGRPIWSGSISFGLVNIPIRLYPAIRAKDIRFHLLHDKDKSRLQEKLYCPVDEEEVPRQEAVKGFEVGKGQHVVVTQEEIDTLAPKASRTIELVNVVDLKEIDPMYFDRPFYILPEERAEKAYTLLMEALRNKNQGAIAKFVMRNKEYIGALRPVKNVLCLETMHFADEIVAIGQLDWKAPQVQLRDQEVKMAEQLLETLQAKFDPSRLHDDYRDAMLKLIQKKVDGEKIEIQPEIEEEEAPQVIDLMAALKRSVAEAQRHKGRKVA